MTTNPRKDILVYEIPEEIRGPLVVEAKALNVSLNDLVVAILSKRFRLKHTPSGAPYTDGAGERISVRAGLKLHQKIDIERARRGGGTLRGVVIESLALHYNLVPPPIGRRPRKKAPV